MLRIYKSMINNNYDIIISAGMFIILFVADIINAFTVYNEVLHNWLMPIGIGFAVIMIMRILTTSQINGK